MSIWRSVKYAIKETGYNPLKLGHLLAYMATATYVRFGFKALARMTDEKRAAVAETYHSKVIPLKNAKAIVRLDRAVEVKNLDYILPFKHAKDVILKNPQNIVVYECACRAQKDDPCGPTDVCLVIGEPFSDLVRLFQPFKSKRISAEQAVKILEEENARGHIHTAWFKTAMLDRFYTICNCCRCCCGGLRAMREYQMRTVLPSGYSPVISEACNGCGVCRKFCQFEAISMRDGVEGKKAEVDRQRCFGCGVCESKCVNGCISLMLDPVKGEPLDIVKLAEMTADRRPPFASLRRGKPQTAEDPSPKA